MTAKRPRLPSRRYALMITMAAAVAVVLALVALSPFALSAIAHYRKSWAQLSNIGQTYGAVSALLSSLALAGVVASLLYQARDSQATHEQLTRTFHHELLKMEMEDPALMTAVGAPWGLSIPAESEPIRQYLYIQMWVSFLAGSYLIGETSESLVRYIAEHELFRSRTGRMYWEAVSQVELRINKGRRARFYRILDEEYKKVLASNVPVSRSVKVTSSSTPTQIPSITRMERAQLLVLAATAAVTGLLAGRFWYQNKIAKSLTRGLELAHKRSPR